MRATKFTALAATTVFAISLAACGSNSDDSSGDTAAAAPMATTAPTSVAPSMGTSMVNFGPGCAAVPTDPANAGSFEAMGKVPVATAASGNPLLSTLVAAVKKAGLVDSLNSADGITVFAPTNDAFAKIPKATLDKVLADKKTLTSILTYHVVSGKLTPADLAGPHKTLQGQDLTVAGSGESFTVGTGKASVICGNVQTANANVYIVDSVLMPKS
ncbi:fasciclin [Actinoplanes sp. SE50]|uniref:fasciclin domain-containing protein n=1 Tax=unclassified Actinoplanes TaxID=2626549 RepID=UPI00023ED063|nr:MULTISPECIES: fasciclin domain-containing protein [unclassified Actinoplanes]AEV84365.1 Transforming growth factor-beta-induced protein ig-h3 [Actinoplanes sp. SE50/110]ATO82757.1 fasciclin [Actinoplanes sp. SE50]SLM00164.1 secreted and surface protein containing fasciclin-like repeats [Actinoplanes sp. SE50/110]